MPDFEPCAVTSAFLARVVAHIEEDSVYAEAYEEPIEQLRELLNRQASSNSRIREHQRAFLCIEMMLHCVANNISFHGTEEQRVILVKWPRSREGLNRMISALRGDSDNLTAAIFEFGISKRIRGEDGTPIGDGMSQVYNTQQRILHGIYRYTGESAVILRRSLLNPRIRLSRIGIRLAKAAILGNKRPPQLLTMADALLKQTESMAPRAWEIQGM